MLDPACGAGAFLLPAAQRLTARRPATTGPPPPRPDARPSPRCTGSTSTRRCWSWLASSVAGHLRATCPCDARDQAPPPTAAEPHGAGGAGDRRRRGRACRGSGPSPTSSSTAARRPGTSPPATSGRRVRGRATWPPAPSTPGGFDVVVGNPPFANQLERLTARRPARQSRGVRVHRPQRGLPPPRAHLGPARWPCRVRPAAVGALHPRRGPVRRAVVAAGALTSLWVGKSGLFDAAVPTCALVVPTAPSRRRSAGGRGRLHPAADRDVDAPHLAQSGASCSRPRWGCRRSAGARPRPRRPGRLHRRLPRPVLRTRALRPRGRPDAAHRHVDRCTDRGGAAGDLGPHRPGGLPVGAAQHALPQADLAGAGGGPRRDGEDPQLAAWAARRLVPKVLLATQGKVLEAVADPAARGCLRCR